MTCTVRVIPCLDVLDGRVVKGVQFRNLRDAGDVVELGQRYESEGADEIVLLDISATPDGRRNALDVVSSLRDAIALPLTVGGGVRQVDDARDLLLAGADKVATNTAAVADPALVDRLATAFGVQCTVVAIDAKRDREGRPTVVTHSGARTLTLDAVEWACEVAARGAGEILLTSHDRDGTGAGYDLDLLRAVTAAVRIPVVASGGAAAPADLVQAAKAGATGLLAATIFHDGHHSIASTKRALSDAGIRIRRTP